MRVAQRAFLGDDHTTHRIAVLIAETEDESRILDEVCGKIVHDDGLIATGAYELRLADGYGEHYVTLHPPPKERADG